MSVLDGVLVSSGGGGGAAGIGGSTGATDNAALRADGTGGATLQGSFLRIADSATASYLEQDTTFNGGTVATFFSSGGGGFAQARAVIGNPLIFSDGSSHALMKWSSVPGGALGFFNYLGTAPSPVATGAVSSQDASGNVLLLLYPGGPYVGVASTGQYIFSSSATSAASPDTGLARNAAGVVRVTNGSTGIGALLSGVLVEPNTAGSGAPNVIAATESGTVYTNEGATAENYHTLPTAVAGYQFTFIVQDADGMRIVANTDDTIRVIDKVTAAAGYIESTTIGSVVTLISVNAVEWYVKSIHGVWTDGTFTFDDTALTTP